MKTTCLYCARSNDQEDEVCESCGAVLPENPVVKMHENTLYFLNGPSVDSTCSAWISPQPNTVVNWRV